MAQFQVESVEFSGTIDWVFSINVCMCDVAVSNSVLTDEGTSSKKKKYNYTGIRPEQFWGITTIHGVLIYQSRSPNSPKQVHCKAAQNAVLMHDAMIASSGTGTAGPLMETMHSS